MNILAIADEESAYLWDYFEKSKLKGIDLIISCGDLDPRYLSFLATFTSVPILYVHGNHDEKYQQIPPDGCICIDDKIYVHQGVRILGLGGSMRYRPGDYQYTEWQMKNRVRKLWFQLFKHRGFDIQGFQVFRTLLEKYRPKFFLHGHVHMSYGRKHKRYDVYQETHVINAFERCEINYEDFSPENVR